MAVSNVTDAEFARTWKECGNSPTAVTEKLGITVSNVYARRARLAKKGVYLPTIDPRGRGSEYTPAVQFERRRKFQVDDGVVVVFSDPHWVPDHDTAGQDALEEVIRQTKPQLVICGGDAVDGDTISRWDPTRGHHKRFSIREELECVKMHLDSIRAVSGKAKLGYTLGNHCVRLSRYIAVKAPELLDMPFTRLEDWFGPAWPLSWTIEINTGGPGMTVVRHRNQAGMLHLQATKAGCHYVHGHLHKINVHTTPTFAGYRYSIDAGSLADPNSESFDYAEGAPNHCQGFAVLTYKGGKLMPPELCQVIDGTAWFRGKPV
jgi:hypothetical protein